MTIGDVLLWCQYKHPDGVMTDKLLVVIGQRSDGLWLMLQTTSKPRSYRPDSDGCHAEESVFRFKHYLGQFNSPTWVLYDPPVIRSETQINSAGAKVKFKLKNEDLRSITNCYKRSPEISDDLLRYL